MHLSLSLPLLLLALPGTLGQVPGAIAGTEAVVASTSDVPVNSTWRGTTAPRSQIATAAVLKWRLPSFSLSGAGQNGAMVTLCAEPLSDPTQGWALTLRNAAKKPDASVPMECAFSVETYPYAPGRSLVWNVGMAMQGMQTPLSVTTGNDIGFGAAFLESGFENYHFTLDSNDGTSTTIAITGADIFPGNNQCFSRSADAKAFRAVDGTSGDFSLSPDCTVASARWAIGRGWTG